MQRFILNQNIERYRTALVLERDERLRYTVTELLAGALRDLALFEADQSGVPLSTSGPFSSSAARAAHIVRNGIERSNQAYLLLHPGPGLHIVDANRTYLKSTMTHGPAIFGERLFDVFPDNPDLPVADGVSNLFRSLSSAAATGKPDTMPIQRYDVRDPNGAFVTRRWRPRNTPVFDEGGKLLFLLHHVREILTDNWTVSA
jgi:hypothetical protein